MLLLSGKEEMLMSCYDVLYLIITLLGVFATAFVGMRANKISITIEQNNRKMEQIAKRPAPIIDKIYVSKGLNIEDYNNHMRFFYGNMNSDKLSLGNQVYVKPLSNDNEDDITLVVECLSKKNRIYFTYFHENLCLVYNNIKHEKFFIFEYCSTKIKLNNYKNIITSIKINFVKIIDQNGTEIQVEGINQEKQIVISENGYIDIMMCFAANDPEETLCINKPEEYDRLPSEQKNILKAVVNEPMLKYKTLIFNCNIKTIDGFLYTYELTVNTTNVGFETWTEYISDKCIE